MNTHDPAPGANDDSSGTAVSLEAARVLSRYKFPATLVFVTVAGEEQGLNGSHHLARLAKEQGWQLEGVLNNNIVSGDTTPGDTLQSKQRIRVFSQGILPSWSIEQIRATLATGGESETPSRQLARQVLAVGKAYLSSGPQSFHPVMELRLDRFAEVTTAPSAIRTSQRSASRSGERTSIISTSTCARRMANSMATF